MKNSDRNRNSKPPSLHISLVADSGDNRVTVRIDFWNQEAEEIQFFFSNVSRKAELLGLKIIDRTTREIVEPIGGLIGIPILRGDEVRTVRPGECWSYDLVGVLEYDFLRFPGARYFLMESHTYELTFSYHRVVSNMVKFRYCDQRIDTNVV